MNSLVTRPLLDIKNSESFTKQTLQYTVDLIPGDPLVEEITDAQHHVFLDQPIAFTESLRAMLISLKGSE